MIAIWYSVGMGVVGQNQGLPWWIIPMFGLGGYVIGIMTAGIKG
jgi:hypothetical protein